ncbi:alfin-like PHD finger protein [Chloropicon primus]|uniref:Alfin-like PHD finger protein n=1 Tax=Chloropicon primus TaxID=1764295 RepID=A0A5B8MQQ5_9CHLO|nr:alfin-like PHD finger protein [Chloropicon primus]UPR01905.1 alfin-like PHD finger protein [Chloropicon primus]|mmetsp:Transcript_14001/g.39571  ORF Transcript_14001/g.39571 Transcript_14001/m.39571 type:complete len:241 (+) Transcript_14001:464-1186(+)|eukprot:QDZ22681.1 alfin-like PHD finger protein [Chloropicon primus]
MKDHPRSVDEIAEDYRSRREALLRALTEDVDKFYSQCDPDRENLCLYGEPDGQWKVDLPEEEVPPELPEPVLGINFARDGMQRKDWIALIAVHSDAWLMAVAYYYGAKLDKEGRQKLFKQINGIPTVYETVTGKAKVVNGGKAAKKRKTTEPTAEREPKAQASATPLGIGRLLTDNDVNLDLRGRQAELFWPDDNLWYLIEIQNVNVRQKQAKIMYTDGSTEELDLEEIIRDGHMSLITQ